MPEELSPGAREDRTQAPPSSNTGGSFGESGTFGEASKDRLSELLAMAMAYRDWSQKELAAFLGRDVHNLIPASGIPKVDIVYRLARALDWPPAAVLEDICGARAGADGTASPPNEPTDFRSLNRAAYQAWLEGDFARSVDLSLRMAKVAGTPEEAAEADKRESVAWNYLGRFQSAIEAANRGLARCGVSEQLRVDLRANLASCYFALGQVHESQGVAQVLLEELDCLDLQPLHRLGLRAHALYVRGQCRLHRVDAEGAMKDRLAHSARLDYSESATLWERFARESETAAFLGRAHMCRAGLVAADAVLGTLTTAAALHRFEQELELATDLTAVPRGDRLEAIGWWAVLGAMVAMRADLDPASRARHLAVFANKAHEVAELSGNWLLRERAFIIDFMGSQRTPGGGSLVFDAEDLRTLTGAMGRFPAFRPKAWEMLRAAARV